MNRKRKLPPKNANLKILRLEDEDEEIDPIKSNNIPICNDTEAAILFLKNILLSKTKTNVFPPVVFVHQIFNVIENKTTVNRQIVCVRYAHQVVALS